MKRRILLVDDDLSVLLTLKAVLELHGFDVETAGSSAEALARMQSGIYQMVITDLCMETEEAGLEVIRTARRQSYAPATALLTAYLPSTSTSNEQAEGGGANDAPAKTKPCDGEDWDGEDSDSLFIKPLGTADLLRRVEALLILQADRQARRRDPGIKAQEARRHSG
jgi:CheY-like chemotaxis protein